MHPLFLRPSWLRIGRSVYFRPLIPGEETSRRAVHHQWFPTLGLLLAAGMLLIIAAAALGFGLVLAFPLSVGALMIGYEVMFSR